MKANHDSHIEKRLKRLEAELEQLRAEVDECKQSGWRAVVGSHQGSQTFDEIVAAIRKHREADYARARGARQKRRPVRKAVVAGE